MGGGVRPAFQNPYPIYAQNLRYSQPYLWPDQKFENPIYDLAIIRDLRYNSIPSSDQC